MLAFVVANPYAVLDFSALSGRASTQPSLAGGADPVKLGTTAGSGIAYYLWTLHLGAGLGAGAGRARRRACCCSCAGGWRWRWC